MENFKAIKFLCTVEKYLNIHRDCKYLTKRKRILIIVLVFLDSILEVLISMDNFVYIYKILYNAPLYFYGVMVIQGLYRTQNYLYMLYFAPRFSGEFYSLLSNLSCADYIVRHHTNYKKSFEKLKIKVMVAVIAPAVVKIVLHLYQVVHYVLDVKMKTVSSLLYYLYKGLTEIRYVVGLSVYCVVLASMRIILKALTTLTREAAESGSLGDNIDSFAAVYRLLVSSSEQLKRCFDQQVLFSAFIAATHFIYLLYRIIVQFIKYDFEIVSQPVISHLLTYVVLLLLVAKNGQGIRNDVNTFQRTLAGILSRANPGTPNQGVKDLLRMVSSKPFNITLLPTLSIGMYLVPAVLSFTIDYTIVTLQMNDQI